MPDKGWYEDPNNNMQQRYWDGGQWTEQVRPWDAQVQQWADQVVPPTAAEAQAMPTAPLTPAPPIYRGSTSKAERKVLGKQALSASLALFRQNRRMLMLPIIAGLIAGLVFLVVSGAVAVPMAASGGLHSFSGWREYVVLLPGSFAASFVVIYANVALAFAASEQIEGRTPTIAQVLAMAWTKKRVICAWAIVSAIVGTVIRFIEQRAGVLGKVVGVFGGLAWAVATFMIIPVLAFEDIGPIKAVERSSALLKNSFGVIGRASLRFGALMVGWIMLALAVFVIGLVTITTHAVVGIAIAAIGALGLFMVSTYASTAGVYLRTVLYRYATGQPVPNLGVDFHALLSN